MAAKERKDHKEKQIRRFVRMILARPYGEGVSPFLTHYSCSL
jgi:hypothetical protein